MVILHAKLGATNGALTASTWCWAVYAVALSRSVCGHSGSQTNQGHDLRLDPRFVSGDYLQTRLPSRFWRWVCPRQRKHTRLYLARSLNPRSMELKTSEDWDGSFPRFWGRTYVNLGLKNGDSRNTRQCSQNSLSSTQGVPSVNLCAYFNVNVQSPKHSTLSHKLA